MTRTWSTAAIYRGDLALPAETPLHDGLVVGRSRFAAISIPDPWLSRHHARFALRDDGWHVQDLGASMGVTVDGRPVEDAVLRAGDELRIGPEPFVFEDVSPAPRRV
jgi:pSer/pThr/pTyr-binding forkhead associated (FHA) protein